jgi:hypothetical protein
MLELSLVALVAQTRYDDYFISLYWRFFYLPLMRWVDPGSINSDLMGQSQSKAELRLV